MFIHKTTPASSCGFVYITFILLFPHLSSYRSCTPCRYFCKIAGKVLQDVVEELNKAPYTGAICFILLFPHLSLLWPFVFLGIRLVELRRNGQMSLSLMLDLGS
jgi:hypothetical protein